MLLSCNPFGVPAALHFHKPTLSAPQVAASSGLGRRAPHQSHVLFAEPYSRRHCRSCQANAGKQLLADTRFLSRDTVHTAAWPRKSGSRQSSLGNSFSRKTWPGPVFQLGTAAQARQDDDEDDPALESDSFDDDVPPAGAAQGNPAVPGDDLDALIDDMEDELPGLERARNPVQYPDDMPEMPQREFPEPPLRAMTLNELMLKAELPAVEGPGGDTLVCGLAMTPGHVLGGSLFFSLPGSEFGNELGVYTAAYYDASVVLAEHDFSYDDEERQEVYTKIDLMEGEMKSIIATEQITDDEPDTGPEDDALGGEEEDLDDAGEFAARELLGEEDASEEPALTTDYLDDPEYTVDPPGQQRKAEAAEAKRAEEGEDADPPSSELPASRDDPRDTFLDDGEAESGSGAEEAAGPSYDGSDLFWAIGEFAPQAALQGAIHTEGVSPDTPQIRFPDKSEIDNERIFDANDLMKTIENPNLPLMMNIGDPNDGEMRFGDGILTASPAGAFVDPESPEMQEEEDVLETLTDAEEGEEYEDEEDEDEDIQMARDDADVPFSQEELRENFPPVVQIEGSGLKVHQLAKAFYDDPSSAMTTIGVAGAAGKTTLTWLIRGMFEEHQQLTGVMGSLDYSLELTKLDQMGDIWEPEVSAPGEDDREHSAPFHIVPWVGKYSVDESTPDACTMQRVLAGMRDRGAEVAVIECEVDAMAQGSCDGLDLDVAIFNNFYEDKAQELGLTNEEYRHRMGTIFRALSQPSRQRAIINIDSPYADEFRRYASRVPVVTFAVNDKEADVSVADVKFSLYETEMKLSTPVGTAHIITGLLGRQNVQNILAAVATGLALDLSLAEIITGIEATGFIPGRSALVDEMQEYSVVVDGARTPLALSRLLDNMRECGPKRIWLVFGCQGEMDEAIRPLMGEIAHYKADIVILTSDNPRRELPQDIINGIISGYPEDMRELNANCDIDGGFLQDQGWVDETEREFVWYWGERWRRYVCEDRFTAIRWAISTAQERDMVIIAGKGSEDFQEVASQLPDGNWAMLRGWFNDHSEARAAILATANLQAFGSEHDRSDLPWVDVGERESRFWDRLAKMRETRAGTPATAAGMGRSIV
ncbi:hypothetical protein WJX84_006576 [Apatococcus fuscideae]|uniref:Uncharacterized protein n=1 Tax=Apatococcus fuscideae TaxID=2026836 RepID=A0AAW1TMB8_9CHLO